MLTDTPSQAVAAAIGWSTYLTQRREAAKDAAPSEAELLMMTDTFCRLDVARWQLSGAISGRVFGSITDGGVLATLDTPKTLDDLGISDEQCRARRQTNYGVNR